MKKKKWKFKVKVSETNNRHIHLKDEKTKLEVIFKSPEDIDLTDFQPIAFKAMEQMIKILEGFENLDVDKLINPIKLE